MPEVAPRDGRAGSSRGLRNNTSTRDGSTRGGSKKVAPPSVDASMMSDDDSKQKPKGKKGKSKTHENSRNPHPARPKMSVSKRLDLHFPIGRIGRYLKKGRFAKRISRTASVFVAAVLDYMVSELIVVAADKTKQLKKNMMKPRHIQLAILEDVEFVDLLKDVMISQGGGSEQSVRPELLGKYKLLQKKKKMERMDDEMDDERHPMDSRDKGGKARDDREDQSEGEDQSDAEDQSDGDDLSEGEDGSRMEDEEEEEGEREGSQEYGE